MTTPELLEVEITGIFSSLRRSAKRDLLSGEVAPLLLSLVSSSLTYLANFAERVPCNSKVEGKSYFRFRHLAADSARSRYSRPINAALFEGRLDETHVEELLASAAGGEDLDRKLYTIALSYCAARDLIQRGDRKSPGRFFEVLVGYLVATRLGSSPSTRIPVQNLGGGATLTTDYVFDLGPGKARLHLPVKTSTRERIIQVWAHQRILDGVYGFNRFRGLLVSIGETNYQGNDNSVVEVCLPDQWKIYQTFIAQLTRVYYLDVPRRYLELATAYPFLTVAPLSQFFDEADRLVSSGLS